MDRPLDEMSYEELGELIQELMRQRAEIKVYQKLVAARMEELRLSIEVEDVVKRILAPASIESGEEFGKV